MKILNLFNPKQKIHKQPKSEHQLKLESGNGSQGCASRKFKVRITKESDRSPCKIGEIVMVTQWGSFGQYDEYNRWVDFYSAVVIDDEVKFAYGMEVQKNKT